MSDVLDAPSSGKATTDMTVVSSAIETAIYSTTISGGALSTNRAATINIIGEHLNNSGNGQTCIIRAKFGGITLYQDTVSAAASASSRAACYKIVVSNSGTDDEQNQAGFIQYSNAIAATTGIGDLNDDELLSCTPLGGILASASSSLDQVLSVTIQHGTAHANLSFIRRLAFLVINGTVDVAASAVATSFGIIGGGVRARIMSG